MADPRAERGLAHPVFLVGAERSGTTLLRLMLDNHPEIAFLHEFEAAVLKMPERGGFPGREEFLEYLRTYRFPSFEFEIDPRLEFPELVRGMLEQKRTRDRKPRLGATCHLHYDRVLRLWPEASFIKMLRDPRDVARSCIGMGWAGNVYHGVERWLAAERLWDLLRDQVPESRRIEVRFEDLVRAPERELSRLSDWFGVKLSPRMLEYMSTDEGRGYRYPDPTHAERWRRDLSRREVQLVELRVGALLAERGYPPSGYARISIGSAERRLLQGQNRYAMLRHRLAFLGPRLWAESVVASRTGPRRWRERVARRVNAVIQASLE